MTLTVEDLEVQGIGKKNNQFDIHIIFIYNIAQKKKQQITIIVTLDCVTITFNKMFHVEQYEFRKELIVLW
jgi:hypothetical protein